MANRAKGWNILNHRTQMRANSKKLQLKKGWKRRWVPANGGNNA